MAKSQAVDEQCPVEVGLNILSGKWKLKILWNLSNGTIRFNELDFDTATSGIRGTRNYHSKGIPGSTA